jgi:hypothetical protein
MARAWLCRAAANRVQFLPGSQPILVPTAEEIVGARTGNGELGHPTFQLSTFLNSAGKYSREIIPPNLKINSCLADRTRAKIAPRLPVSPGGDSARRTKIKVYPPRDTALQQS